MKKHIKSFILALLACAGIAVGCDSYFDINTKVEQRKL